jgi:hypothetical protein
MHNSYAPLYTAITTGMEKNQLRYQSLKLLRVLWVRDHVLELAV